MRTLTLCSATLAAAVTLGLTSSAPAAVLDFTVADESLAVDVTLNDVAGGVQIDLVVNDSVTGNVADLRGAFFNLGRDELLPALAVAGDHVTGFDFGGSVGDLGNGANINPNRFHTGVEIGTAGAGKNFIPATRLILSGSDLNVTDFLGQSIGIRATSVGSDPTGNANGGSVKLVSIVPVPEPGVVAFMMLPALLLCRRTRRTAP